ncbi:uncharacterized protein LOC105778976 [Gossypium raimondii]|uniref:uncharacterized protein LOC105778976 n=1 Tax=Gossypium raimondii TaxID=29730 RepID=UPI00227C922F|nr:uncharacterized protein LOC105778976 [Gossypium raimondii]
MGKSFLSQAKKSREMNTRSNASSVNFQRDQGRQYSSSKAQATSMASVGSVKPTRPECQYCGKRNLGECYLISRACLKCRSQDHFVKDCPEREEIEKFQNVRSSSVTTKGRPPRNVGIGTSGKGVTEDTTVRSKARAPARAYAIRAREEAPSPDVITGIFSLYETNVLALIDPGSTHSYICMNLVSDKNLCVELTEYVVKV